MMTQPHTPNRQSGAALVVGLIMLLVLTLIGISSLNMTTLELRMASNQQNKNHAFQAAETGIEAAIPVVTYTDINTTELAPEVLVPPVLAYAAVSTSAWYVMSNSCPGQSLTQGLQCNHFQISAVGQHLASNSSSAQAQGVYMLAPGSGP